MATVQTLKYVDVVMTLLKIVCSKPNLIVTVNISMYEKYARPHNSF